MMSKADIKKLLKDAERYCKSARGAVHFADAPTFYSYLAGARSMLDKAEEQFNEEWRKRDGA